MSLDFEKFAREGAMFVHELSDELGHPGDFRRTGRILKAVLHTVRDYLPVHESVQLLAQLPPFLKAVYTDGWSLKRQHEHYRHADDFLRQIRLATGPLAHHDLPNNDAAALALGTVFRVLRRYISLGEFEDIRDSLPREIRSLVMPVMMI